MPEAPEVRIYQDYILKGLSQEKIKNIRIFNKEYFDLDALLNLKEIIGFNLSKLDRIGKSLIFYFSNNSVFLNGLGMTGYWRYNSNEFKHCHFEIEFEDGKVLQLFDPRRFGRFIFLGKNLERKEIRNQRKLGPDIFLLKQEMIDFYWARISKSRFRAKDIKTVLLEQSFIAGIGNYLACEILFRTKIHPKKKYQNLTYEELKSIIFTAKELAEEFYSLGGNQIKDFKVPGVESNANSKLLIYGKKICTICNSKVQKILQDNRSTYFCLNCQKGIKNEIIGNNSKISQRNSI